MLVHRARLFQEGVASVLERQPNLEVVSKFTNETEAIEKVGLLQPDVILLDEGFGGVSWWAEATKQMSKLAPKAKIILLTYPWTAAKDPLAILEAGATAFISKDIEVEDLIRAIALLHTGKLVIFPPMSNKMSAALADRAEEPKAEKAQYDANLSEREKQVLAMAVEGKTNKEISEALLMSEHTVRIHMRWIMAKLQVRNRAQVVALAVGKAAEIRDNRQRS
jgi:DNA-binding NarL/FixJ family response regulator